MHQITLKMARVINKMELEDVERKTGIDYAELKLAEEDSRLLKYDDAVKLQQIYKLPSLSMIFIGEEKNFQLTNHHSGLDLLEIYIDFIRCNRRQASYIMVWFEAVVSELSFMEISLIRRTLTELEYEDAMNIAEFKRTKKYLEQMI